MGTSQFLTVPYAMYADKAGNVVTYNQGNGIDISGGVITNSKPDTAITLTGSGTVSISGKYPQYNINSIDTTTWKKNSTNIIYYDGAVGAGAGVGIGTKNPSNLLHLMDTIGNGGVYSIMEGYKETGVQLWTHESSYLQKKVWVLQNGSNSSGNAFSMVHYDGTKWSSPITIKSGAISN